MFRFSQRFNLLWWWTVMFGWFSDISGFFEFHARNRIWNLIEWKGIASSHNDITEVFFVKTYTSTLLKKNVLFYILVCIVYRWQQCCAFYLPMLQFGHKHCAFVTHSHRTIAFWFVFLLFASIFRTHVERHPIISQRHVFYSPRRCYRAHSQLSKTNLLNI